MTPWGPGPIELGENAGLTLDEIRARQLRDYKLRATTPVMPEENTLERPDIRALYDKLGVLNRKPLDYSAVEQVAKSRGDAARRDLGVGMTLQALGGTTLAPAGGHILAQALEAGKPLRANAADVAYEDPTTGKMVENPMMQRTSEEKIITGRIDARIKEEEARARIAVAQGHADDAATARQNAEALRLLALSIAQQNANTAKTKADKPTALKPVPGLVSEEGMPIYHDAENQQFRDKYGPVNQPISVAELQKRDDAERKGAELHVVGKQMIKDVTANPGAFSKKASAAGVLPGALSGYATSALLTEKEQIARSAVLKNAYTLIHDLTGAVLSGGESKRMAPFVVDPVGDPPDVVLTKLKGAMREYELILDERKSTREKRLEARRQGASAATGGEVINYDITGKRIP